MERHFHGEVSTPGTGCHAAGSLVMEPLHAVAHPGVRVKLISARFFWPRLASDVSIFGRQCLSCQRSKVSTHVQLTPDHIPVAVRGFEHMHEDKVCPLPSSGVSHTYSQLLAGPPGGQRQFLSRSRVICKVGAALQRACHCHL
jgi:hypothetical protein